MKVSAQEIVDVIPSGDLIRMAIYKLLNEGKTRSEIIKEVDEISWAIEISIKNGEL